MKPAVEICNLATWGKYTIYASKTTKDINWFYQEK